MGYREKPLLKLYEFDSGSFRLVAIIDDYMSCSCERNMYEAGQFTIDINFNIPNARLFRKNQFVQFGNDAMDFGVITTVHDSIGSDGKGSQIRSISGFDCRYLLKRRIIKTMNSGDSWKWSGTGEMCIRNLIREQCGELAEEKRRLPIVNTIPASDGIGFEYSVSESYSNVYEVCVTIATQTEVGWCVAFRNGTIVLEFYSGGDLTRTVRFDTDYNSLESGDFEDSSDSYSNSVYIGGKGSGENRDIYEGESLINPAYLRLDNDGRLTIGYKSHLIIGGDVPSGMDRFESFDSASGLESEEEYINENRSMLSQYSQSINLSGEGLARSPYEYRKQYDVGDTITVAFSGISVKVQILSITEHWTHGKYDLQFEFGKPVMSLSRQLNVLINKIQSNMAAEERTASRKDYYLPTDTGMNRADVACDVITFTGSPSGAFRMWFDPASLVGAKTYHVYLKGITSGLTLTTGRGSNVTLPSGTYVTIIYIDTDGSIYRTI